MSHRLITAACPIRIAIACALLTLAQTEWSVAESSPYQARVVVAGASVQSGPGDNFYQTGTLTEGDTVEVYREKSGGWLAIRPPEGSYSWVAQKDLELKDDGLAEVLRDDVPSRIGSRLNDRHNASQIRLKKGENVEVLGEENINGEKWCKISPPAGEFRWVHASVIERTGSIEKSEKAPAPLPAEIDAKVIKQTSGTSSAPPANDSVPPPLLPISKPTGTPAASAAATPASNVAPPSTPPTSQAAPAAQPATTASQQPATQATGDVAHDLASIELRLSRMAAAPTNLWNTEKLEHDIAQLMARAKTQPERDAIKATQGKISRFAQIGRRANQAPATVAQTGQPPATTAVSAVATANPGGTYDAVGILRPVVSRRPGAPQFALVDERGQVVSFVTSTPDLNLQPYLGHRIGVVGNRGYIPEFQRANVTAARVTPLNDRMVR